MKQVQILQGQMYGFQVCDCVLREVMMWRVRNQLQRGCLLTSWPRWPRKHWRMSQIHHRKYCHKRFVEIVVHVNFIRKKKNTFENLVYENIPCKKSTLRKHRKMYKNEKTPITRGAYRYSVYIEYRFLVFDI